MEEYLEDKNIPKFFQMIIKLFLYSVAIFHKNHGNLSKLYYFSCITINSASALGSVFPLLLLADGKQRLEAICGIVPQFCDLYMFIYFHHKKKDIFKLIVTFSRNQFDAAEVLKITEDFFKIKFLACIFIHSIWAGAFGAISVLCMFSDRPISEKYSLMIPYWYSCGEDNADTIFRHFCWKIDTKMELWLSTIFCMLSVTFEYVVYCMIPIFYSLLMANVWKHLETYKSVVRQLIKNMNKTTVDEATYNDLLFRDFCNVVKYQQFLRSYCIEIIDVMYGYVFIFLMEFVGTLISLLFTIIMETRGDEKVLIVKGIIIAGSALAGFILQCFFAQTIADLNETILNELFNIPWYEQSIKFRKIYIMCLTHNQKSLRVTAGGMYTLNYEFFMNCLRTIYSILNIILWNYRHPGS